MKYKTLLSCLVLVLFLSCNRNEKNVLYGVRNDSVEKYLKLAENFDLPLKERDLYSEKALSFIDLGKIDTTTMGYIFKLSKINVRVGNDTEYKKISRIHLNKALDNYDTLNLARFYRIEGTYYRNIKINDSAFFYYIKSEKLYKKVKGHYNELAYLYINLSYIQELYGDYLGADLSATQCLVLLDNSNNYNLIYDVFTVLGNLAHTLKSYDKAIEYQQRAYKLQLEKNIVNPYNKHYNKLSSSLNNIGNSYREMGNYEKAIYYFDKALKEELKTNKDPEIQAYIFNNLGYVYLKQKKYTKLPFLFEKASKIFDSTGDKNESAISNMYLSDYYFQKNDTARAIAFSERALQLTTETKTSYYYLTTLSHAGYVNQAKAPFYIKKYHEVNDSLVFEERKARNQLYKIQLETDEITLQKENAIKQKWTLASVVAMILCIVILLFIVFWQKSKQVQLILVREQQKANESIYQLMLNQQAKEEAIKNNEKTRIAMELHDNVMNKLASTRFNLFMLSKKTDAKTIENALVHIEKIKDIENEIRDITHDLTKETLNETSTYHSLLLNQIEEQNKLHETNFVLDCAPDLNWDKISSSIKMNLLRIIQEAIQNIIKHSQATEADITIIQDQNNLCMSIHDNGIGYNIDEIKKGIGLKNIKHRVQLLSGEITIHSNKTNGTTLNLKIPIQ